jgi:Tfp pilus assembly protein PilN
LLEVGDDFQTLKRVMFMANQDDPKEPRFWLKMLLMVVIGIPMVLLIWKFMAYAKELDRAFGL